MQITPDGATALISVGPMQTVNRGSWRAERYPSVPFGNREVIAISHYTTTMMVIDASDKSILYLGIGRGSRSDQGTMNRLFQALNMAHSHYYTRKGGTAEIVDPRTDKRVPRHVRKVNEVCGGEIFKKWQNNMFMSESERQAVYSCYR